MQVVFVIVLVAAALSFLGYRFYKTWFSKKKPGCDKCISTPLDDQN